MAKRITMENPAELLGHRMAEKISAMVGSLIELHFEDINETWEKAEDGKMKLSANVALEGSPRAATVAVKLTWSQKFEAEIEGVLDDPAQGKLGLEGE